MSDSTDSVWQRIEEIDDETALVSSKTGNRYDAEVSAAVTRPGYWDRLLTRGVRLWGRVRFNEGTAEVVEVKKHTPSQTEPLGPEWEGTKTPYTASSKVTIYTAGAMDWENEHHNREDSTWRAAIVPEVETVEFLNPTETFFDHGADPVSGCVSEDLLLLKAADGVLAYFNKPGQIGTMVEVFEAFRRHRPLLCVFDPKMALPHAPTETPMELSGVDMRSDSEYWFLINYLVGDADTRSFIPDVVPRWTGRRYHKDLSVWRAREDQIAELVEDWVAEVF